MPTVLLHGVTRDASDLATFARAVPRSEAITLIGHGEAPRAARYRIHDYAAAIAPPVGAVLYGHSLGGLVALARAAAHPGSVAGVVMEDPPLFECHPARLTKGPFAAGFAALHRALTDPAMRCEADWRRFVDRTMPDMDPAARAARARELWRLDPAVMDAVLSGDLVEDFDPHEALAAAGPVTLIAGERRLGSALTEEDLAALSRHANVRVVRVAGAGHRPRETDPDACAEAVAVAAAVAVAT